MRNFLTALLVICTYAAFGSVNAGFTSDKISGCPPLVVNFTDKSTGGPDNWQWSFGNGNTSTLQNPSATFLNPGTYVIKLVSSNGSSSDSIIKTIQVFKLPKVDFTVNRPDACLLDTLNFTSNVIPGDAPIAQYAWGFGNGIASSVPNAFYSYNQLGIYDITLVVQDTNGCAANKTRANYITVRPIPTAAFTASPVTSCNATQTISFTNQSTPGNLTYSWNLDAGVTSTATNPTHTYTQTKYTVVLTATDATGCSSRAKQKISVTDIQADFKASKVLICAGQKIQFTNMSNFPGTSWRWDFGDGTSSKTGSPIITYSNPGVYTVKFVVYDGACGDSITKDQYITVTSGFSSSVATFSADTTHACGQPITALFTNTTTLPGGDITYLWNFGNGDTSSSPVPTETFDPSGSYNISLTLTDTNGCTVTGTVPNYIQTGKPTPKFIVSDTLTCSGGTIIFANQSAGAKSSLWIFGDGDSSTATNAQHQYYANGIYDVTLYISNGPGCDTSITKPALIHVDSVASDFRVNSTFSPCPPFVAKFSSSSNSKIVRYEWDFGDGYTDTAANPTHIYFYPGVYTVKMVTITKTGCTDTTVYADLITVQGPTGHFTVTPTTGCVPLLTTFSATVSANTQSSWCDLGDGFVLTDSLNFTHTYVDTRIFHPQFVLTDYVGCSVAYPLDSIITYQSVSFNLKDTTICAGQIATLSLADTAFTYKWSPAAFLNCDTCNTVYVNALDTTTFNVVATSKYGCTGSASVKVNVEPLPALAQIDTITLCPGDTIPISVGKAAQIEWTPVQFLSNPNIGNPLLWPTSSIEYTVTGYNALGCTTKVKVPVVVKDKVAAKISAGQKVCEGTSITLNASVDYSSATGVNYNWNQTGYLDNGNLSNPTATLGNKPVTFTVIVTSGHCVADTQSVTIGINPSSTMEVSDDVITTIGAEVPLYASSIDDLKYQWFTRDSISCTNCRRPNLYPQSTEYVYVEGTNKYGCVVRDSVHITVNGCDPNSIFMPNTFTPNGDGINDKFLIRTAALRTLKYFRVFDAWGQLVFETDNINEGWDGKAFNQAAPTAVYVYVVQGTCQNGNEVTKTGNVAAVR